MGSPRRQIVLACAALAGVFLFLYSDVIRRLVHDWATDDNYSHGFLVVPIAAFLVWERWAKLQAAAVRPSNLGLLAVAFSQGLLIVGTLGSELFVTRISMVVALAGAVIFVAGWQYLKVLAFPLGLLFFMIPIPAIIFNQIAFPLQLLASRFGTVAIAAAGVPVLREGNLMILANTTLEVAEACSGLRSLMSLLTLGIVIGYFGDSRGWARTVIAVATIPIAIFANAFRVAGTGIGAHYLGPKAAEGFLHTFSGWLVFVFALSLVFALRHAIARLAPIHGRPGATRDVLATGGAPC